MNGNIKFKRYFFLLPLMWLFLGPGSSCQRKGVLRCPDISGKGSTAEVKGKDGQSVPGVKVTLDKNGRVKKNSGLKFW